MLETEERIKKAHNYVINYKAQRELYNKKIQEAKEDYENNVPHECRRYTLVVDFFHNLDLPHFGGDQPGDTYCYSLLGVYCFGVVDPSGPKNKLYANLYTECEGEKGGNNVTSFFIKVLEAMGIFEKINKVMN